MAWFLFVQREVAIRSSFNKDISKNFDRDIFSQTAQKVLAARRKIVNFQVSIMAAWEMNASQGN